MAKSRQDTAASAANAEKNAAIDYINEYPSDPGPDSKSPLRKMVADVARPGVLEKLAVVLRSLPELDIDEQDRMDNYTALHEAFSCNNRVGLPGEALKQTLEKNPFTKAIDLLIENGASPIENTSSDASGDEIHLGKTPLMCLEGVKRNPAYTILLIDRYSDFEAAYYGVDKELYKKAMLSYHGSSLSFLNKSSFRKHVPQQEQNSIETFWKAVQPGIFNARLNAYLNDTSMGPI